MMKILSLKIKTIILKLKMKKNEDNNINADDSTHFDDDDSMR